MVLLPDALIAQVEMFAAGPVGGKLRVATLSGGSASFWPSEDGLRFHIGSVTKTFTALLLAQMATTGEVALDDPVASHLEADALADVRLVELATHASGLPRLPDAIVECAKTNPEDPYSAVTREHMLAAARHVGPGPTRGAFEYSNFGFALLGMALGAAAGTTYQEALRDRVLRPLGLSDTVFDTETDDGLTDGHDLSGTVVPHWHNPFMAGCGSLLSTTSDLAAYLAAELHPDQTLLADAIRLTQAPRELARPELPLIGLSWLIEEAGGTSRYWHNGGTYGFSSYVAFEPDHGTAVALVLDRCRSGDGALEGLGRTVLDGISPRPRGQIRS